MAPIMIPAVLGTGETSTYRALGAECYDLEDITTAERIDHDPPRPVIAHPRRNGSRSRHPLDRPAVADLKIAMWSVAVVQRCGGVLVQPANSQLWALANLPVAGEPPDAHDGITLPIWQSWFGHHQPKPTWLYIVGYHQPCWPAIPIGLSQTASETSDAEKMPHGLAVWLFELATRIGRDFIRRSA